MARVTVEDCVKKVDNRFKLVLLAAQRAKDIGAGAKEQVERDRDKNPVIALREIEEDKIDLSVLENELVTGMQKFVKEDVATGAEEDEKVLKEVEAELADDDNVGILTDAEAQDAGLSEVETEAAGEE